MCHSHIEWIQLQCRGYIVSSSKLTNRKRVDHCELQPWVTIGNHTIEGAFCVAAFLGISIESQKHHLLQKSKQSREKSK